MVSQVNTELGVHAPTTAEPPGGVRLYWYSGVAAPQFATFVMVTVCPITAEPAGDVLEVTDVQVSDVVAIT